MDSTVLIQRFARYCEGAYDTDTGAMPELAAHGQKPPFMVIGCIDSRTAPELSFFAEAGEMLCKRHATAMVPPYRPECEAEPESTEFAVNFAVDTLGVQHIIILFHRQCGGVAGLMANGANAQVNDWAEKARNELGEQGNDNDTALLYEQVEKCGLIASYHNLCGYPAVSNALENGYVQVHGWYFDISRGALAAYQPGSEAFTTLFALDQKGR